MDLKLQVQALKQQRDAMFLENQLLQIQIEELERSLGAYKKKESSTKAPVDVIFSQTFTSRNFPDSRKMTSLKKGTNTPDINKTSKINGVISRLGSKSSGTLSKPFAAVNHSYRNDVNPKKIKLSKKYTDKQIKRDNELQTDKATASIYPKIEVHTEQKCIKDTQWAGAKYQSSSQVKYEPAALKNRSYKDAMLRTYGTESHGDQEYNRLLNIVNKNALATLATCLNQEKSARLETISGDIFVSDIYYLIQNSWLSERLVNHYCSLIVRRSHAISDLPKVYAFQSFQFSKYQRQQDYNCVKKVASDLDVLSVDILIFPVLCIDHWVAVTVDLRSGEMQIKMFDSLVYNYDNVPQTVAKFLQDHINATRPGIKFRLIYEGVTGNYTQGDADSCGVFALDYLNNFCLGKETLMTQNMVSLMRKKMAIDIVNQYIY